MRTRWIIGITLMLVAGLVTYQQTLAEEKKQSEASKQRAELGQKVPDFKLKDVYGKEFKLSDFKKKIVVLEWVNRDCPVSRGAHKAKLMQKTYGEFAPKGVIWLGIDSTAGIKPERNRVHAAAMHIAYPILQDPDAKVANIFDAERTPHMFVIDKEGVLVYAGGIGDGKKTNFVADALKDLLADRPVSKSRTRASGCSIKNPKLGK
jgi:peroxiredoxin